MTTLSVVVVWLGVCVLAVSGTKRNREVVAVGCLILMAIIALRGAR